MTAVHEATAAAADSGDLIADIAAMAAAHATRLRNQAEIGADTRLAADLGLKGDDAQAFLDAFTEKYAAHLGMLRFRRYFQEEGFDPLAPALAFWLRLIDRDFAARWRSAQACEREITIGHMARVAAARRWIEPDVSARPAPRDPRGALGWIGAALWTAPPLFLAAIMPVMLALMLLAPLLSGNWTIVSRNLWLVFFMTALAALQGWIARNSWRAIERKLATGVESPV